MSDGLRGATDSRLVLEYLAASGLAAPFTCGKRPELASGIDAGMDTEHARELVRARLHAVRSLARLPIPRLALTWGLLPLGGNARVPGARLVAITRWPTTTRKERPRIKWSG